MSIDKNTLPTPSNEPSNSETSDLRLAVRGRGWVARAIGILSLVGMLVLAWVFHTPLLALFEPPEPKGAPLADEPVRISSTGLITVSAGSPLSKRLHLAATKSETIGSPILSTTGYVIARLAPGADQAEARWDFASVEIATSYADWLNARADRFFFEKQAAKTRELVKVRTDFLKTEWDRKEKGYLTGSIPERDRVAAKADYLQADLQGQKDITDAETSLKKAERSRALLERQLFQVGVDPEVVRKATEGLVLVVADVPEAKINVVNVGQACEASFFGVPGTVFHGRVGRLGPSLSKEKRTLRVTFELTNPNGSLLPGMFADIGLGTESRRVLMVPADAALHVGQTDYILREESPGQFRAIEVKADEPRTMVVDGKPMSCVPVLSGLHEGDRVVAAGAILLKPFVAKSLTHPGNGLIH